MLPSSGKKLWISPTVGGRLNIMYFLRFSGWFIGYQWQQGYLHAQDLDARGYWHSLPRGGQSAAGGCNKPVDARRRRPQACAEIRA
eukprot:s72_g17.t1